MCIFGKVQASVLVTRSTSHHTIKAAQFKQVARIKCELDKIKLLFS